MAPVYVLDACVLYSVVIRDLLLTLAALDAFEPRWTEAILDEMTRNMLADHPTINPTPFEAGSVGAMRRAFPVAPVLRCGRWRRKKRPPMSPADVVATIVRQQGFGALEDPLHDVID